MRRVVMSGIAAAVVLGMLALMAGAAPREVLDVKATLRGEVLTEGLARPGDEVVEGDPLVYVRTKAGRAVAARAPADGRVLELLVTPGAVIRELGAVVARIEAR